jgi:hypothetical protein
MRHPAIRIRTEEPDYSDIPRTEYHWEFSVYRGAKEELSEDAPEPLGKHGLLDIDGWKRFHSLAKIAKKMLRMVNQSKLQSYKTCKKYMDGFEIPRGYEDAIRLSKLHGNDNKWQSATKLEMDQLHEYDTFHEKSYQDNSWGGVQEDPSSSCVCVQAPDSILFGSLGSDNISIHG